MEGLKSNYNALARKVLIAAESGESEKFKGLFKGRQPEEVTEALCDVSQERYNDVLGNVRFTPFIAGAWHGHIHVIDELLEEYKVDVNQAGFINVEGKKVEITALCAAIRQQNLDMANCLLERGADINRCSPLSVACYRGDVTSIRFLAKHGADINARLNKEGVTPLMVGCERFSLYIVRLLLNSHADPRLEDMDGNTALHRLALKQRMYVLKNGPLPQIIDTLVASGAQMSVNQAGQTPLTAACASGNVEVARAIMCLPEVRPEEQLTAQEKLRKKLESDVIERNGSDESQEGEKTPRKTSWTQKFTNPNELRKLKWSVNKKSKKTVADKIEDIAENNGMDTVHEIATP
nr:protein fem-1 homolog CG6966-like [Lytechinus pictus]XP_054761688.1 protein fem-1 homolog CG6966-like [Lytechinus pictus]